MRISKSFLTILALLLVVGNSYGQRRNQIEFYGGAALPLSPDDFKEYTKAGFSGNFQYVLFPSPRLGITFQAGYEFFSTDDKKFTDALSVNFSGATPAEWRALGFDLNSSATVRSQLLRLGAGVRPYLTIPEATTQFFLLGQVNFNFINNDFSATNLPFYDQFSGNLFPLTFDDKQYEKLLKDSGEDDNDENVLGVGLGGGIELPAGESINLVFQALFNVLFTSDQSTSFVGITAGVVF